jgi:hypothetical protein
MHVYIIQFLMSLSLFFCFYLLNVMAGDRFLKVSSFAGIIVSIGFMFYILSNSVF